MAEDLDSLASRPGWTVNGAVATYAPQPSRWTARVTASAQAKYYAVWHIAIIDPHGRAQYVMQASQVGEAVRVAERQVLGRIGPPGPGLG